MDLIEKATVLHYHRHRIHQFQPGSVEALGWRGSESQRTRFEVLLRLGDFNGSTVLDAGCGHGDLKLFLDRHCLGNFTYIGIDQMPEFIEEAKTRYGSLPDTHFYWADFTQAQLPRADYVIASGAFCYRSANSDHHFSMIRKLFKTAKIALAFNMLDAAVFPQHALLIGHNRSEVAKFCRGLTSHVETIDGYLEDDFTVMMHRDGAH